VTDRRYRALTGKANALALATGEFVRKAVDGRWIEPDKRKQLPGIGDRFRPRGAVHVALMLLRRSRSFQQPVVDTRRRAAEARSAVRQESEHLLMLIAPECDFEKYSRFRKSRGLEPAY
jgi:hypothetical protein